MFDSKLNLTIQIIAADISSTLNQFYFTCFPLSNQNQNNVQFDFKSMKFSLGTHWGFWACNALWFCKRNHSSFPQKVYKVNIRVKSVIHTYFDFICVFFPQPLMLILKTNLYSFFWGIQGYEAWFSQQQMDFHFFVPFNSLFLLTWSLKVCSSQECTILYCFPFPVVK